MTETPVTLDQLKSMFDKLDTSMTKAALEMKDVCSIMDRQTKMLALALDQLLALSETQAIPVFFRQQILVTILKMKEIHG